MKNDERQGLSKLLGPGLLVAKYQPITSLTQGAVVGFEILARWCHESRGEILPSAFIPCLERRGGIEDLASELLTQAFGRCQTLPPSFGLSMNVSPLQLRTDTLPRQIECLAQAFRFDLRRLTVEVTESALIDNVEQARSVLEDLKALGVQLSLDDFGTGYSSLSHLHALPFDEVKIDRSFVESMTVRRDSRKIVAAVIGLGRSLGLVTVAEGVEQSEQADMLHCLGCERAQGWLFGHPLPGEEMTALVLESSSALKVSSPVLAAGGGAESCLEALPATNHAQLQAIYDGVPVGLCFLDCDFRYVSLNQHLAEMNGRSVRDHLGKTVQQVVPWAYEAVKGYLERARDGEAVRNVEVRLSSEGSTRSVLLSYQPAFDEAGEVIGISVVITDISSMRATEAKLRDREDHYRTFVELTSDVPWTLDAHGQVTEVSPRWRDLTGQTEAEALQQGWLKSLHPDDAERAIAVLSEAVVAQTPFTVEYRVRKGDGSWHWIRSRGVPKLDSAGQVTRWYGNAECIDVQKRYEASLEEANGRLQKVLDALPVGVVIAEAPTGRILRRNPAAQALLHQDPILFETIADYAEHVTYYTEGRRLRSEEFPLARAIEHGETTRGLIVFCDLGNARGRWLRLTGNPLCTSDGVIFGAVATIQELPSGPVFQPLGEGELQGVS